MTTGCDGGRRYLGFSDKVRPEFEHFLSCGIPGQLEGERYNRTPELVRERLANRRRPFQFGAAAAIFRDR